ncbi:MAG: serine/threonine-protein kinase [Candidatus Eisenbacteria bacterium]|uniref:non-specific serine/threonine protein kinase n=1 Tax=Eiseniibacteriota bacterium TaxID=2212470 RepID=A0A933W9H2_UNCEI|nr:serine/threonine-protein kinase [Candidatus Eisenbacteria bacterium]
MPLTPGTKLGPYEVVAPLGAGGMGEVYRAHDTRLGRDVAIKVLPAHLSADADVRARFEREAKAVAALNHPNICVLHDVGREGETDYLVMELVEGETLSQRLLKGALPPAEVLRLGAQIADALDRAHRAGVVHRDLKPGNVMITKSGAKLMDFGLARATASAGPVSASGATMAALTQHPTVASPLTAAGAIVGTFQYMSPEQLEGREADSRADIWALGCVLHEMATGQRAFDGRSQASLISAIMTAEPAPISQVAPLSPPALDRVVARCLAKDPDDRWQTARDLMHELRALGSGVTGGSGISTGSGVSGASGTHTAAVTTTSSRRHPTWHLALVAVAALVAGPFVLSRLLPGLGARGAAKQAFVLSAPMPPGLALSSSAGDIAVAPDGSAMVFVAADSLGETDLWYRPLGAGSARKLPGTTEAMLPFWSADGAQIGFFAGGKLRRVAVAGGSAQDICEGGSGRGATWNRDGVILFTPAAEGPIFRVSADGGTPVAESVVDTARHEGGHRFPRFLPDGRHYFFTVTPSIQDQHDVYLGELGSPKRRLVLRCDGSPVWSPSGWLLYRRNGLVHGQRWDPRSCKFSGQPVPLVDAFQSQNLLGSNTVWLVGDDVLLTIPDRPADQRLAWVSRDGSIEPIAGLPVGGWSGLSLSPDGSRVIGTRRQTGTASSASSDLWIADLARGSASRFTSQSGLTINPVWSPDGRTVYYSNNGSGVYEVFAKSVAASGAPAFVAKGKGLVLHPDCISPDGRTLVLETQSPGTGGDLVLLRLGGGAPLEPLVATAADELEATLSPDGRWIAYSSNESGQKEIYVDAFPSLGARQLVSTQGGGSPTWSRDGRSLFWSAPTGSIWSVTVTPGERIGFGSPALWTAPKRPLLGWDVASDDRRLVAAVPSEGASRAEPRLIVNWRALLEQAEKK